MKVLVCGGRDFENKELLYSTLTDLHREHNFSVVIHGCASGADTLAGTWATENKIQVYDFPADWKKYGKSAGAIRNRQMLEVGVPDMVVAFPGGRGTKNMIDVSNKAGIPVILIL